MKITRFAAPVVHPVADANIRRRYAIERAAWLWHPEVAVDAVATLQFTRTFTLDAPASFELHVSADQRYELFLDGRYVGMGPDRGDMLHWSFASYEVELEPGEHTLHATVWWLGDLRPVAQITARGGFICATDGLDTPLNTGEPGWTVRRLRGLSYERARIPGYHVVGPAVTIDAREAFGNPEPAIEPAVVVQPVPNDPHGVVQGLWQLEPSPLPEMMRTPRKLQRALAITHRPETEPFAEADARHPDLAAWQDLLTQDKPIQVPPQTALRVIIDLDQYYCGYEQVTLTGGRAATVSVRWAEALYEVDEHGRRSPHKSDRNAFLGKVFVGFGDTFIADGAAGRTFQPHWWRAGRYLQLTVQTADEPLTIDALRVAESRYPLEYRGKWSCEDAALNGIIPLAIRGMQMCSHETYMDCPYYEQLMYVGDTRLEMLTGYTMTSDDRLTRRGIELFDYSRWKTGFVAERYPSMPFQLSLTFAMIWVAMLRDYAWWRDDAGFVRERMTGMRCLLEQFFALPRKDGLLAGLPGWSFVDWVPGWERGNPPNGQRGASCSINLLYLMALRSAADLEQWHGDAALARRWDAGAEELGRSIVQQFWDGPTQRLADDLAHQHFSEHSQCLGLLTGLLEGDRARQALNALIHDDDLARTTVYFSFYLLETLYRAGRGDVLVQKLDFWKSLVDQGFKTPVETPEPSRSDCHAWGSHPLMHLHASIAGVRPDAPGFRRVRIAPQPGPLREIEAAMPHPRGEVVTRLRFEGDGSVAARITLPPDVPGVFCWNGRYHALEPGSTTHLTV